MEEIASWLPRLEPWLEWVVIMSPISTGVLWHLAFRKE